MISSPVFSQVGAGPPRGRGCAAGGACGGAGLCRWAWGGACCGAGLCRWGLRGAGLPRRWAGLPRARPAPAHPACALLLTEVAVAPLEELRGHKALAKLQSRQERDLRELHKKHQRKAVALTRRLLDSLAQARAEGRCRPRPGVL